MERGGTAVTRDGRLFHRRAAATGNALSPTVDRRVRRTPRDVDEAERSRRLDSVSAGRLRGVPLWPDRPCWGQCEYWVAIRDPFLILQSQKSKTFCMYDCRWLTDRRLTPLPVYRVCVLSGKCESPNTRRSRRLSAVLRKVPASKLYTLCYYTVFQKKPSPQTLDGSNFVKS